MAFAKKYNIKEILKIATMWRFPLGLFLILSLSACQQEKGRHFSAPFVEASTVHAANVPINFDYAARIAPYKQTQVRARVGGILLTRFFDEGAYVKQNDVLFEIDPKPYALNVLKAEAQANVARINYEQAVRDAQRAEQLVNQRVQSTVFRDQAFANRDAKQAVLKQAEADLETARLNLQYTKVRAPISGITSREAVPEGSLIGVDPNTSLLTTITQINPVYVNFSYSDADSQRIKKLLAEMEKDGHPVQELTVAIFFGDGQIYPEKGVIDFTSSTLDSETGTLGVRAVVPNKQHNLIPGQFVRVRVEGLEEAAAIKIPEGALMQDAQDSYVFVLQPLPKKSGEGNADQKQQWIAVKRNVKIAQQLANRDWLLSPAETISATDDDGKNTSYTIGLKDGEILLTKGHLKVQAALAAMDKGPGVPVQISCLDGKKDFASKTITQEKKQ